MNDAVGGESERVNNEWVGTDCSGPCPFISVRASHFRPGKQNPRLFAVTISFFRDREEKKEEKKVNSYWGDDNRVYVFVRWPRRLHTRTHDNVIAGF